jgi:hypothetical protein
VVVREGARKRPGSALLHRPEEILVDAEEYEDSGDDGIRQVLDRVGADDRGDDVAGALGLRRLAVPGDVDLVDLVRSLRDISPGSAALNAVLVADPQRYGGSAPPEPASRPEDIPGDGSAGEGVSIAVLDTGFADRRPFRASMPGRTTSTCSRRSRRADRPGGRPRDLRGRHHQAARPGREAPRPEGAADAVRRRR